VNRCQRALERLCSDRKSGAFVLTKRAVRLLVRMAKGGEELKGLVAAAERIAKAHPAMAPLWHLAQKVRALAGQPKAFIGELNGFLAEMERHGAKAVEQAALWLPESRLLTHSFSSLVFRALRLARESGKRIEVVCTASFPGGEGITLAGELSRVGVTVVLVADLQAFEWLPRCDLVLFGADAWCLDGLVHKVGTRTLALAAHQSGVPVFSLGTSEKRLPMGWREEMKGEALPVAPLPLPQDRTLYDLTKWSLLTGVLDEEGVHSAEEVAGQLAETARAWHNL